MNPVSIDTVRYIAALSRIHLEEKETEDLTHQLASILGYIAKLETLPTQDAPPTSHVFPLENVYREDRVQPSLIQSEVLAIAVEQLDGSFKVPKVIE